MATEKLCADQWKGGKENKWRVKTALRLKREREKQMTIPKRVTKETSRRKWNM